MGLFTGVYKAIARELVNLQVNSSYSLTRANYKGTDDATLIEEAYLSNADMYSLIQMDVKKFASIPVNTYKVKVDEKKTWNDYKAHHKAYRGKATIAMQRKALEEVDENNEVSKLLRRPNPYQGADQFWQTVRGFFDLTGETFIWKSRLENGKIDALYCLPTQYMLVIGSAVPDILGMYAVDGYVLRVNGKDTVILKEDIIHWKGWTPEFDMYTREQLRGMSPLKALMKSVTASNDATDAMVAMYQNGGAKGVLFNETLDELDPAQQSQLKGVIDRKINNKQVKAAVAALQGKWGYLDLGMSSVDMQLLESLKITRKQFADAMGIPADLVEGDKTYANREQSMKDWVSNSLYPAWKSLCDELNRGLAMEFGLDNARVVVDVDVSLLPEMQDDQKMLTEIAEKSWWMDVYNRQVFTGNEPDPKMKGVYVVPAGLQTWDQLVADIAPPMNDQMVNDLSKLYEPR